MRVSLYIFLFVILCAYVSASTVTRELPKRAMANTDVDVKLMVEITEYDSYYLILEKVPEGMVVIASDGDYKTNPEYIMWVNINVEGDTQHYYTVRAKRRGLYKFIGTYGFETKFETETEGDKFLRVYKPNRRWFRWLNI